MSTESQVLKTIELEAITPEPTLRETARRTTDGRVKYVAEILVQTKTGERTVPVVGSDLQWAGYAETHRVEARYVQGEGDTPRWHFSPISARLSMEGDIDAF